MEKALLDSNGEINEGVKFKPKADGSGIDLQGFNTDGLEQKVEETIQYKPHDVGNVNPGAGQVGIYKVKDSNERDRIALVKDYKSGNGDWRIFLINMTDTEREMKNALMVDSTYGTSLTEYLMDSLF